jgi:diaminopimelate decarboxylase
MDAFVYKNGEIFAEDTALADIARAVGTPVYVYAKAAFERHYQSMSQALGAEPSLSSNAGELPLVAFAMKSNGNMAVLATLARCGAGADTVSEGEIRKALHAGIPADKIIFSGVGKRDEEMAFALKAGVYQINIESRPEMERLEVVAASLGLTAPLAIRINPGVGAGGHAKITTGGARDKFGVSADEALRLYAYAAGSEALNPLGIACHIGSLINDLAPLREAFIKMKAWVETLRAQGLKVERLDLGGGLGVSYFEDKASPPTPLAYAKAVAAAAGGLGVRYIFEPGRFISANAGVLLSRVIHVHERADSGQKFLVLDAAMNDLIRPALYDAYHDIRPLKAPKSDERHIYDIVGPVCETGDTFSRDRALPQLKAGDLVAFMSAGAYGAVMASEYNQRPMVPEVLVGGANWAVVRPRPSCEDMLTKERVPDWV